MKNKLFFLVSCIIAQGSVHAMEAYPLHDAVTRGDEAQVTSLLASGVDLNQQSADGWAPLHLAAITGQQSVAQLLLDRGADVNQHNNGEGRKWCGGLLFHSKMYEFGSTPMHLAAYNGHLALVEFLSNRGATIDSLDSEGETPLHGAAFNGHSAVVQFLLTRGANANHKKNRGLRTSLLKAPLWTTPLHTAALGGFQDVATLLLENGADVNALNYQQHTPLHWAAGRGHLGMAQLLLSRGADINLQDYEGFTPLHKAAINAHTAIVQLFLGLGNVRVSVQDGRGFTPFQSATYYGNGSEAYQIAGLCIKSHMEHAEIECPVCLQSAGDIAIAEHAATPCCKQFICRNDLATLRARGDNCPICRGSLSVSS